MEAISEEKPIRLSAQERKRLADYLDVLIEMHFELKRNYKRSNNNAKKNEFEDEDEIEILLKI